MKISLIITTYNSPEALELCLLSVLDQTRIPDEVIIADDGSTQETRELVEKIGGFSVLPVIHSWQDDKGFRAAKSRNSAISKAVGDYIIMVDGDIILERHFVRDHIDTAQPGQFIQGSRVILSKAKTKDILVSGDITLFFFSSGIENRKNCIRSKTFSKMFSGTDETLAGVRACNSSFWKKDAIAVNGFNEEFEGWGREDSEFARRLMNYGIKRFNLRFLATAFHLYHSICVRENIGSNDAILENTVNNKLKWCSKGLKNDK